MNVFHEKKEAHAWVLQQRQAGKTVGLVPTMGALHAGHYSLVTHAQQECDATIATIFVNPTQFGPGEDLAKYPQTLDADLDGLRNLSTDAVFVPASPTTMYLPDHSTYVTPPIVASSWEGVVRPHHFRGVATIVLKLFHLLPATTAFFGQKDYQQAAVIRAMVEEFDLDIEIRVCPIVRDPDGLAMSSRNRYLTAAARSCALAIPRALQKAAAAFSAGERRAVVLESTMYEELARGPVDGVDYAVIADAQTLQRQIVIDRPAVALVAARLGSTRLIDNHLLSPTSGDGCL